MSEQLHETTPRIFIPNVFRPVLVNDQLETTLAKGRAELRGSFIPVEYSKLRHDVLTTREIDSLRQRPSSSTLASNIRKAILPNKDKVVDVRVIGVKLFSTTGHASTRGYNVMADFKRDPLLDEDRAVIEENIVEGSTQQTLYRPQILLGKLFQSAGKKEDMENFFSLLLPKTLELGPVEIL